MLGFLPLSQIDDILFTLFSDMTCSGKLLGASLPGIPQHTVHLLTKEDHIVPLELVH